MEFNEIKEMFDMNNKLTERINEFRCNRVLKYSAEDTNHYKVIYHSIPLNSFSNIQINLEDAKKHLIDYQVLSPNGIIILKIFINPVLIILDRCLEMAFSKES